MINIIDKFIKKYMIALVLTSLFIGFLFGLNIGKPTILRLKSLLLPSAFIMLWSMMINMDPKKFVDVIKYPKELLIGTTLSLVVSPLIMLPIAMLFAHNPKMYAGLVLAGIVPPGGFTAYWTGVLYADIALAVAIELVTFLVSLVWIPYGTKFLVGGKVNVNVGYLFKDILILIVAPFTLAVITRYSILKIKGKDGLNKIRPGLHLTSSIMAFFLVFAATSMKAKVIYSHPGIIILPAIGAFIYYFIMFPISYYTSTKLLKLKFETAIPLVFGASTKNLSIAMALAAAAFGPMTLLGVVSCTIFQMPFAAIWYKVFDKIRVKKESLVKATEEEIEKILEHEEKVIEKDVKKVEQFVDDEIDKIEGKSD